MVGRWHGYLSGARCRLAYCPADATATHCLYFNKIQIGFTFLVPAHPGSPGKGPLNECVCLAHTLCAYYRRLLMLYIDSVASEHILFYFIVNEGNKFHCLSARHVPTLWV